jgi:hypothetical protein
MPMIDIYAAAGTFGDIKKLSADAAALVKSVEQVPDIPMFRSNTAAFVHEMPAAERATCRLYRPRGNRSVLTTALVSQRESSGEER